MQNDESSAGVASGVTYTEGDIMNDGVDQVSVRMVGSLSEWVWT